MQNEQVEELVKKYLTPVYSFVFRLVRDKDVAEDITQDTFIKAWKKIDATQNVRAFLFTIARNLAYDYFRKNKDEYFEDELEVPDTAPLAPELLDNEEIIKNIHHKHLELILLHDVEDMTFEEIANIVGRPMNTVKSQYRRAVYDLHQKYKHLRI
jgi:RNA polymerase sigma-70 factor (ECF subfamily)